MLLLSRFLQHVQQRASCITVCFSHEEQKATEALGLCPPTSQLIVTHKLVANISWTQSKDICILTKFHRWLYTKQQTKLGKQLKKASKISICKCGRRACHNCRYYTVHSWREFACGAIERRSTCTSTKVCAWHFAGHLLPLFFQGGILLLCALWVQAKLVCWERQFQDFRESAGWKTLAPRANCSYASCDRLFAQTCGSTFCMLAKNNGGQNIVYSKYFVNTAGRRLYLDKV